MSTLRQQQCLRCGHHWWPRQVSKSRRCPGCRSPYWDRPRRRDTHKSAVSPPCPVGAPAPVSLGEIKPVHSQDDCSLRAALELLRGCKTAGLSWSEMTDQVMNRFGVKLDKDQLKALVR